MSRKDNKGRALKPGEFQRPNGTYEYRYKDILGGSHSVYGKTLQELRDKEKGCDRSEAACKRRSGITVYNYVLNYLKTRTDIRETTRSDYKRYLGYFEDDPFMQADILEATRGLYGSMLDRLSASGLKHLSVRSYVSPVKSAMAHAFEREIIPLNPCVVNPKRDSEPTKRRALTPDQLSGILAEAAKGAMNDTVHDEIVFLAETGLRVSEFLGLTCEDFDFDHGTVHVVRQRTRAGKDAPYGHIALPKSLSGIRDIPLSPDAETSARRLLAYREEHAKRDITVDGVSNFLSISVNGVPKDHACISIELRDLLRRYNASHPQAQITQFSPHILRHTFCTNLVYADLKVKNAQYLMGHSDPSITLRVYTDVRKNEAIAEMRQKFCTASKDEKEASPDSLKLLKYD